MIRPVLKPVLKFLSCLAALVSLVAVAPGLLQAQSTRSSDMVQVELNTDSTRFPGDLRWLGHRPAGKLGRVQVNGSALEFGDGTPARFWGVNIQAYALFRTKQKAMRDHAARLARMGVNLVRIHHHDSDWVKPNIFGKPSGSTTELDANALRQIDNWIAALKEEGIYIWLDLHVGRRLGENDPVQDSAEILQEDYKGDLRGFNFVNDDIVTLMERFAEQYLTRVNPLTGLSYAQDPAIAVIQISNENDLTKHFAGRVTPNAKAPNHAARYTQAATRFAETHGLPVKAVASAQSTGPAQIFLNDLEHRFFDRMTRTIRGLGYEGILATSSFWGRMWLAGLPSLVAGDLVDVHSYARPGTMFGPPSPEGDMLSNIALANVVGKPLTVSEWNMGRFPGDDRFGTSLRIATMAAFQGWDATMLYGYGQQSLSNKQQPARQWHSATDPTMMATLPVAALLYRAGHVQPARETHVFAPDADQLFGSVLQSKTLPAFRALPDRSGLRVALPEIPQLPWFAPAAAPAGTTVFDDPEAYSDQSGVLASDTGELTRNTDQGYIHVDTPHSQVAAGRMEDHIHVLSGAQVQLSNPLGFVAVQSLGEEPLSDATEVLVTVGLPTQPVSKRRPPFEGLPVSGEITFEAPPGLKMQLGVPAAAQKNISHDISGGRHRLVLRDAPPVFWLKFSS